MMGPFSHQVGWRCRAALRSQAGYSFNETDLNANVLGFLRVFAAMKRLEML
jgi:hypothetical protein